MAKEYLFKVRVFNKKKYHPLSVAAFCSGEKQFNKHNQKIYHSENVNRVTWNDLLVPEKDETIYSHLPYYLKIKSEKKDIISNARNVLWQQIDLIETREDSQFARLFEITIPYFFNEEEQINFMKKAAKIFTAEGMIADSSIHKNTTNKENSILDLFNVNSSNEEKSHNSEINKNNFTGFILCTLRDYKEGNFSKKNREWNNAQKMIEWRTIILNILSEEIAKTNHLEEEKKIWQEKLTIYPEFNIIKKLKPKI